MIHVNFGQPMIMVQCPKCGSNNIGEENKIDGAMWCNSCQHKVDNKQKDLQILRNGGGEIKPL